ncbi:MAG: hypothetical protein EOS27_27035 [Mesorhizobium sp.]|nr:MAG: hypothetical protein EOS27_27035 [Mesorhizobium sp.]
MGLVDFGTLLLDPNYTVFGETAVLTLDDTAGTVIDKGADGEPLQVIDKTAGAAAGFGGSHSRGNLDFSDVNVLTVVPAAMVRAVDLATIDLAELRAATITFNGKAWTIMAHEMAPVTTGEDCGEIRLILETA